MDFKLGHYLAVVAVVSVEMQEKCRDSPHVFPVFYHVFRLSHRYKRNGMQHFAEPEAILLLIYCAFDLRSPSKG